MYYDKNGEEVDHASIIFGKKEYEREEKIEIEVYVWRRMKNAERIKMNYSTSVFARKEEDAAVKTI